jgi:hypothetical protein
MAQDFEITYGAYVVGGSTAGVPQIHKQHGFEIGFERSWFEFTILIQDDVEATFATKCAAAQVAYSLRNVAVGIKVGASVLLAVSHSGNTGFNSRATCSKSDEPGNSARSRLYHVRIDVEHPATDLAGRRESNVNVAYDAAGIRTITISGVWTAVAGTAARAQYEAQITNYATAMMTLLSCTYYEQIGEPQTEHDLDNKLLRFSRVYHEIIDPQSSAGMDDADIVSDSISLQYADPAPGDWDPNTRRLTRFTVQYSCTVKKTNTNLEAKWDSLRPWLIERSRTSSGAETVALVANNLSIDKKNNVINATLELEGPLGGKILESKCVTEYLCDPGVVLVPVWKEDKENLAKFEFQGPATKRRTLNIEELWLDKSPDDDMRGIDLPDGYVIIGPITSSRQPETRGLPGYQLKCERLIRKVIQEKRTLISGGGTTKTPPSDPPGHPPYPGGSGGGQSAMGTRSNL